MYANKCPNCGAYLDPCERCDCRERERDGAAGQAPAPITAKRTAVAAEEKSQRKTGIVMPGKPMGDSSTSIEIDPAERNILCY